MKKLTFLLSILALSGCVKLDPASLIGTVWEAKSDTSVVPWEDTTMTRIATHSIIFTDSTNCMHSDNYFFSLPNHNGNSCAQGMYIITVQGVILKFAFEEALNTRIDGNSMSVANIIYYKK